MFGRGFDSLLVHLTERIQMSKFNEYPPVDVFLDALFESIRQQVKDQDQRHPEDIMTTVTLMAESVYRFVSNLPVGYGIVKHEL